MIFSRHESKDVGKNNTSHCAQAKNRSWFSKTQSVEIQRVFHGNKTQITIFTELQ